MPGLPLLAWQWEAALQDAHAPPSLLLHPAPCSQTLPMWAGSRGDNLLSLFFLHCFCAFLIPQRVTNLWELSLLACVTSGTINATFVPFISCISFFFGSVMRKFVLFHLISSLGSRIKSMSRKIQEGLYSLALLSQSDTFAEGSVCPHLLKCIC